MILGGRGWASADGMMAFVDEEPIHFARQLIKGRIAEVIFERMIKEEGRQVRGVSRRGEISKLH